MADLQSFPLFYQIAALLVLAAGFGMAGLALRQPLIVSYIAVGLIAGPSALGLTEGADYIDVLAELGIAVLLFLVGLKLDVGMIRSVGPVAVATGLGQVFFTAFAGFLICLGLGLDWLTSLYVAVALTFSSTIIIVKLLSDKGEIGSLHGRIALGFLIVQDVVVVLAMVVLSTLGIGAGGHGSGLSVEGTVGAAALLLAGVALFVRYAATPLAERLAKSPELLMAFAIGWAAFLAALCDYIGFGKELGGLLAGVSLASTPFREAMSARLASLRDFLLLFFFIALGAGLDLGVLGADIGGAVLLSLFVLIGNPLIVLAIMGFMGYRKRTGFLAGLTVAQISEFSLIFMAMGLALGHVSERAVGLVTMVGLITIAASVYMIMYSHQLYAWLAPLLGIFERKNPQREQESVDGEAHGRYDVIVFGLGRYGGAIVQLLRQEGFHILGVDFSPVAVRLWRERGVDALYGDIADPDFLTELPHRHAKWMISAIPEHDMALTDADPRAGLIETMRAAGYKGRFAVSTHKDGTADWLKGIGADLVFMPFSDAADKAVDLLLGEHRRIEMLELPEAEEQKELAV